MVLHRAHADPGLVRGDALADGDDDAARFAAREQRRPWQFALGIFFLWAASDWPIGTLGASYLSSIHMMQFMLYTLAAALAGAAGALLAQTTGFASLDVLEFHRSADVMLALIIGGVLTVELGSQAAQRKKEASI